MHTRTQEALFTLDLSAVSNFVTLEDIPANAIILQRLRIDLSSPQTRKAAASVPPSPAPLSRR
jgi:hypothetical protein